MELLEQYLEKEKNKKTKKEKDPLKPKHPMLAYFIFSNERRKQECLGGEEWKNMTDIQKAPYEEITLQNKEQYAEEMEVYKQKKEEEAANLKKDLQKQEAMQLLKKKGKTETLIKKKKNEEKTVDPDKPKRPSSSFLL